MIDKIFKKYVNKVNKNILYYYYIRGWGQRPIENVVLDYFNFFNFFQKKKD